MASKILFTSGCSFTQKDWVVSDNNYMEGYETGPHLMWPEILANKLNLTPVNHGCGGMGNDYIMQDSLAYILANHKNIDLVCIQWSQVTRMWIYDMNYYNPSVWLDESTRHEDKWGPDFIGFPYIFGDPWTASRAVMRVVTHNGYHISDLYKKYVREIYTLQQVCEELNLPYIFGQGFTSHELHNWRKVNPNLEWEFALEKVVENPQFHQINKQKFIGWPCLEELGGITLTDGNPEFAENKNRINPIDNHPSANGQRLIADQFYHHYQMLYT